MTEESRTEGMAGEMDDGESHCDKVCDDDDMTANPSMYEVMVAGGMSLIEHNPELAKKLFWD